MHTIQLFARIIQTDDSSEFLFNLPILINPSGHMQNTQQKDLRTLHMWSFIAFGTIGMNGRFGLFGMIGKVNEEKA